MRHLLREPFLATGAALAVFPAATLHFLATERVTFGSAAHVLFVGLTAGAATAAAIALTVAGARRGDGRTVVMGTAFSVMAALLVVHGIATPGFLVEYSGVGAFSGAATLPVGGALLVLCTVPEFRRRSAIPSLLALQATLLLAVAALGTIGIAVPSSVPAVPEPRSLPALVALAVGLGFYGLVAWRATSTYRLTRRFTDLLVVVGVAWLAAALAAALLLAWWQLGWWIGHGLEVLGIAAVGTSVAIDLRRAAQSRPLVGDLGACDLVAAEEAFLGAQVRALTQLLAERDVSTEEHTRRVALRAVEVGEELGLSPERLRVLAAGGLLHDMGKLSIPDEILTKPAALTPAEYETVKEHPENGRRLVAELGFGADVQRLVLDHHERIDGSGYPRGIEDGALDLETRILGVCDVYDALVSPRVYRDAWTHADAMRHLRGAARAQFDQRCVAALERVLERERAESLPLAV
jgi:HD-GYP domain-containing protein (c-di-GMP phosphodiesterase class II)